MNTKLSEDEMRQALFGSAEVPTPEYAASARQKISAIAFVSPSAAVQKEKKKRIASRLTVTLRAGNEFEGATELFIHQADTLSTLQAELDALKVARKKFKYVEVISIKSEVS